MSVVIAIKNGDHIVMGADSQVTCGWLKSKTNSKIFFVKDCPNAIMGSVGELRGSQILQATSNLIDELKILKNEINFDYCVLSLYEKIYQIFKTNRLVEKENGEYVSYLPNSFIFAYKDTAFLIYYDGTVQEIKDYLTIGSGAETAQAVLENNKNKQPETRSREAIKVCADKTLSVDNDVVILSTKDKDDKA